MARGCWEMVYRVEYHGWNGFGSAVVSSVYALSLNIVNGLEHSVSASGDESRFTEMDGLLGLRSFP